MQTPNVERFVKLLKDRVKEGLPGREAHLRMIPAHRIPEFKTDGGNGKPSAVLLLLYPKDDFLSCVFIQRPVYNGYHSGQISLPGGKFSPEDRELSCTALREAREEVAIDPSKVELLFHLTPLFIPPSNFTLTPFVGIYPHRPHFTPDPREVAGILELDIRKFSPSYRDEKDITLHNGKSVRTPYYNIDGNVIWGATAMVMSEFEMLCENLW